MHANLKRFANGTERITVKKDRGSFQYYTYSKKDNAHHTLSKAKRMKQIQRLCQSEYNEDLARVLNSRIQILEETLPQLIQANPNKVLASLALGKQCMVADYLTDDDDYAASWEKEEFEAKEPPAKGHSTDKGDIVRSKSEVLIANKLLAYDIPYRYEASLNLPEGNFHPDFTVLNKRTRKVYYWEHLGMIEDVDYTINAFMRLRIYQQNGISSGRNLILTTETRSKPLDSLEIQTVIESLLK